MTLIDVMFNQIKHLYFTKYPAVAMSKLSKRASYTDVNDYLENSGGHMATNAMKKLFSYNFMQIQKGHILEVGAGTGRFTREILKYIPQKVKITCFEYSKDYCVFLSKYVTANHWSQVDVIQGDIFKNALTAKKYDVIIFPWFDLTMSLYSYGKLFRLSHKLLKSKGLLIFDFMDSQDNLLGVIEEPSNSPYFLLNGKDLEKIARHFGFTKKTEFREKFNKQIGKYHIYQKR